QQIKAVDITFFKDGVEIQPQKEVKVTLNAIGVEQNADTNIVHIENDGSVEVMQDVSSNGAESAFGAEHFSVYAIVTTGDDARLHVKFLNGETIIAEPIVKKSDIASGIFDQVVYDPGAGSMGAGEVFRGWTTVKDYTVEGLENGTNPAMTIDQVREAVQTKLNAGVTDGDEMNIYAMIFHVMNVTYKDEDSVVIRNEGILTKGTSVSYTVNESYVPKTSDQEFQGWYFSTTGTITDAAGNPIPEGSVIANETEIVISADVILSVVAPNGYWLIFKENGKGASYTSPQFLEGTLPEEPADPVRLGYEFGGWYTDEACTDGNEFDFTKALEKTTTVYAKWTENQNANYTIIIWKENLAGNGYDFEEAIQLNGRVNTTINTVSAQGTGNNRYARVNGVNKQYTGFHLKEYDQNVTITPQNAAVLQVYYDRNEYALTFQIQRGYNWTTIKTISAKYQQNISNQFPIVGDNGITYNNGERWDPQNSSVYDEVIVSLEIMPAENINFHLSTSTASTKTMNYYVEALPGAENTVVYDGMRYSLYKTVKANYNGVTVEDYIDLLGYSKKAVNPSYTHNNGRFTYYVDRQGSSTAATTVNFYYTRNQYTINFMDGVYVDGNGNPVEDEENRGQLHSISGLAFGATLSSYNKNGANYYEPTYTGYVLEGWYADKSCTQPYEFTTMPEGGVTVYAKWRQIQYRVFLNPGVPTSDTSFSMGGQNTSFRINYGGTINAITGIRDDYELVGWYTDPSFSHAFNFDAFVLNDSTVTTTYDKSRSTELDEYGNPTENRNADTERFWITRSLDLYAKWRSKLLGANGINVVFDAADGKFADGTTSYQDPLTYKDLAMAVATTASTPNDNKKEFLHWVIQKWDGSKFEDTDDTVYPGDTFEVLKAYAHVTENEGSTAENPSYTYLVQLRAEYKDIDTETLTHIDWYANNGTTAMKSDTGIKMNSPISIEPADLFSYRNYEFVGWARYEAGQKPASPVDDSHLWL
ncbi:MAG: InlB B-repeat-containing protein, partial [Solobacterium sp.]|nr:InlB B-repeat-containing protein [Solobacterium sp.]